MNAWRLPLRATRLYRHPSAATEPQTGFRPDGLRSFPHVPALRAASEPARPRAAPAPLWCGLSGVQTDRIESPGLAGSILLFATGPDILRTSDRSASMRGLTYILILGALLPGLAHAQAIVVSPGYPTAPYQGGGFASPYPPFLRGAQKVVAPLGRRSNHGRLSSGSPNLRRRRSVLPCLSSQYRRRPLHLPNSGRTTELRHRSLSHRHRLGTSQRTAEAAARSRSRVTHRCFTDEGHPDVCGRERRIHRRRSRHHFLGPKRLPHPL